MNLSNKRLETPSRRRCNIFSTSTRRQPVTLLVVLLAVSQFTNVIRVASDACQQQLTPLVRSPDDMCSLCPNTTPGWCHPVLEQHLNGYLVTLRLTTAGCFTAMLLVVWTLRGHFNGPVFVKMRSSGTENVKALALHCVRSSHFVFTNISLRLAEETDRQRENQSSVIEHILFQGCQQKIRVFLHLDYKVNNKQST